MSGPTADGLEAMNLQPFFLLRSKISDLPDPISYRQSPYLRPLPLPLCVGVRTLRAMAESPDEKRDRERVEILGELHGEVMIFQPLSIKEISNGGCLVETAFQLHLNSLHDIRLTLGDKSVVLKGRVAHCRISDVEQEIVHYRSGIEFIEPSERVTAVIKEFIAAIKSGRKLA
jgi:hypothetical protein